MEFKLDGTKVVDAAGRSVDVELEGEEFVVGVGTSSGGSTHPADGAVPWTVDAVSSPPERSLDLTEDERITHADAMEAALAWTLLRERDAACRGEAGRPLEQDINGDGCVDVADLQAVGTRLGVAASASYPEAGDEGGTGPILAVADSVVDWMVPSPALAQQSSTFVVASEADRADTVPGDGACATAQGVCTLRAAIEEANLHPGPDNITFNIPGTGVRTIQLESTLPTVSDESGPTTIDGYTQPGAAPNTDPLASNAKIMVQVSAATEHTRDAMIVTSPGNVVRGLSFFKLRRSIWLYGSGADRNSVVGNFVGTNAAGTYAATTAVFPADGIQMQNGAAENVIGGTSAADRNVVSGNAYRGVITAGEDSDANRIINNLVGLGPAGDKRLPNIKHGIDVNGGSAANFIGGTQPGERNVASGNGEEGIEISHEPTTTQNRVVGNFVGTDVSGKTAPTYAYNGEWGIHLEDRVSDNLVADNVVGNNRKGGVRAGSLVTGTVIQNNRIGVSLDDARIPNSASGVQIDTDSSGSRVGPGNIIANNNLDGIRVAGASSDHNVITRNSISGNRGLGIDLEPLGATNPNDGDGDADSGANAQLNFPVLEAVTPQQVGGRACANCTVEVFLADSAGGAHGEGKALIGSASADAGGQFVVPVSGAASGSVVTATATDGAGNTSEFSSNRVVSADTAAPAAPTGLGAMPSQSGVMLNWNANTEQDLAGYSVYRSTTGGGPYVKITTSLLSANSYTDPGAVRDNTYYYVVTATDKAGNESGFGNQASATQRSQALAFDGVNDRVSIPSSGLLNATGTGQRTYELKIKTGANVNARQFVYEEGAGKGSGFSVEIDGGRVYFNAWVLSGTGGTFDTVAASAPVEPNTKYHVAGVYDQSVGRVRLYLDGVLREGASGTQLMRSHSEGGVLGGIEGSTRSHARTSAASGGHFGGLIDEFRVWKQARTQAQIWDGRRADLTGAESGLILLYEAEEGSGAVLNDSSPNNLDGGVTGATWTTVD